MKRVTAALLVKDGKFLIAKRQKGAQQQGKWEFPGGKMEEGETPEECLTREIREELGIHVTVEKFFSRSVYEYHHGAIELLGYWVRWMEGELCVKVHQEIRWVYPHEFDKYDFAPADLPFVEALKKMNSIE